MISANENASEFPDTHGLGLFLLRERLLNEISPQVLPPFHLTSKPSP